MQLPGRLDTTTLGDILGTLYRGHATGVLELSELAANRAGGAPRVHRIHLLSGLVAGVDTDLEVTPIGEILARSGKLDRRAIDVMLYRMAVGDPRPAGAILVGMGAVTPDALVAGLRAQLQAKINAVYAAVAGARVAFRTSRPLPKDALKVGTLLPRDFLHNRPRKRDRRKNVRAQASETSWTPFTAASSYAPGSAHTAGTPRPGPSASHAREAAGSRWTSSFRGYEGQTSDTPPPPSGSRARSGNGQYTPMPPLATPRAMALRTLGLPGDADETTIRRTFKRLAMELHPDRYATSPEEVRNMNAARFAEASAAYHVLVA